MYIVIPAYEPDEKLIQLIYDIRNNLEYPILIVDDGSSEKFIPIFQKAKTLGCTILTHEINMGKGAALKSAFEYLESSKEEVGFVCADCDGQHTWKDIKRIGSLLPMVENTILLGTREFIGEIPKKSLIGNKITSFIYSTLTGSKITDTQTGLRGFSMKMIPWLLSIKGNRYEYEMNQLLDAKSGGYRLFSVPIETIYENNNEGTHFRPIVDSFRIYLPIIKFACSSLSCAILDFVLLLLLHTATQNLLLSVVGARIISSLTNYFINRNLVFKGGENDYKSSLTKYYSLVGIILLLNYLFMACFVDVIGMPLIVGKILTEGILFSLSFLIQNRYIFTYASKES